jgi:hypothetical protein
MYKTKQASGLPKQSSSTGSDDTRHHHIVRGVARVLFLVATFCITSPCSNPCVYLYIKDSGRASIF